MLNYPARHTFTNKVILYIDSAVNKVRIFNIGSRKLIRKYIVYNKDSFIQNLSNSVGVFKEGLILRLDRDDTIKIANGIINCRFSILGLKDVYIEKGEWDRDPKSGYQWKAGKWFKKYKFGGGKCCNADVKYPWEYSRCHHLLWLGEAYLITKEDKYAEEIVNTINNWIDANPFEKSINWTCSMEVAIRSVNWLYAIQMIADSKALDDTFIKRIQKSLLEHGLYIYNNLEYSTEYNANHYYSNIVGLLYLGLFFKSIPIAQKWLKFAINEYIHETRIQFLPSGANYENTISYHRLMTEMALCGYYLLLRADYRLPVDIEPRLEKALDYVSAYSIEQYSPLIGDNDDGRFLPIVGRVFRDHSYLLDVGSPENTVWSCSIGGHKTLRPTLKTSIYKSEAGLAVIKNDESYLVISNSEPSRYVEYGKNYIATHTHNDKLSFEFLLDNNPIIVDPGTYVYTSEPIRRNEFRSTKKHNTVIVDNEEQNYLPDNNVFAITKNVEVEQLKLVNEDAHFRCEGAYITIDGEMYHQRSFEMFEKSLNITDNIHKKGVKHQYVASFHLAPYLDVFLNHNHIDIKSKGRKIISFYIESKNPYEVNVIDDTVSPHYGVLEESRTIIVTLNFDEKTNINYRLEWE